MDAERSGAVHNNFQFEFCCFGDFAYQKIGGELFTQNLKTKNEVNGSKKLERREKCVTKQYTKKYRYRNGLLKQLLSTDLYKGETAHKYRILKKM